MGESGDGYWSHLEITPGTGAGPAAELGPAAEPDGPPLSGPSLDAVKALVTLAAADGVAAELQMPATRDRGWPASWSLPSAWLYVAGGGGVGLHRYDDDAESEAQEAFRIADTAQEALLESMPAVGRPTNWPPCPAHPTTHPLALAAGDDDDPRPRWTCPLTGDVVGVLTGGGIRSTP
ncbi:hypothetical protein ACUN7V_02900 [Quadrisphaera oryzae]|uniref:hypothetical protein n=1 Tax=Quadrisphaera TaxID=317661 RepID=UPI001646FAC2|nr:hypothetical protein [Quadrisphaera sp. RL12-1S]MBC3760985.1 hypothetical protein [Quadrisphaera sp. RL12-1S]